MSTRKLYPCSICNSRASKEATCPAVCNIFTQLKTEDISTASGKAVSFAKQKWLEDHSVELQGLKWKGRYGAKGRRAKSVWRLALGLPYYTLRRSLWSGTGTAPACSGFPGLRASSCQEGSAFRERTLWSWRAQCRGPSSPQVPLLSKRAQGFECCLRTHRLTPLSASPGRLHSHRPLPWLMLAKHWLPASQPGSRVEQDPL